MAMTPLPAAPQRTDPANFTTKSDAFVAALPTFVTEANALEANVEAKDAAATDSAAAALLSETAAAAYAGIAASAANFKGSWSDLSGAATVPYSCAHDGRLWMLLSSLADITAKEPGVDVEWQEIGSPKFVTASETESASLGPELLDATGWTATGWTGDYAAGFSHAIGETTALTRTMESTGTNLYQITFTIDQSSSDFYNNVTVSIGNSEPFELYIGSTNPQTYNFGIQSISDGDLVFTPAATFDGRIYDISVKKILAAYDAIESTIDSGGTVSSERRYTPASRKNNFIGINSGMYNTTGYSNNAVGYNALSDNTSGFWNTAIGDSALTHNRTGSRNSAIGYNALHANIFGMRNNAIGTFALMRNTSGNKNQSIGSDSMFYNTTGSYNDAYGFGALHDNTTGNYNVAVGHEALHAIEVANYNIGVGAGALRSVTGESHNNVAFGVNAGRYRSGGAVVLVNNSVFIGYNASALASGGSNEIVIGANAAGSGSNTAVIGDTSITKTILRSPTVISPTASSGGGYSRKVADVASSALSGASGSIAVNVPSGARILGVQLRVDTEITSGDGATSWSATYVNTPTTAITSGRAFAKSTRFRTIHPAYELTTGVVTITITPNSGTFSGGVVRAIVYYEVIDNMAVAP